jgi:hypothetical protein
VLPRRKPGRYLFVSVIALVLAVAAILRLWDLPGIPPGPHYDEAANGTLAAEIATGAKRPIFIPSYTGKEVLFFYGTAAVMRVLGINLLALRLTSALAGWLTVTAAAWLAYELFADDDPQGAPWLAALTAALIATSFWHVLLSRVGFRAITQPLLQTLTLAALWRGLRQRPEPVEGLHRDNERWLFLAGLLCGLTGYTYLAARAFPIPLVVAFAALLIADRGRRRRRLRQFGLFGLAALVVLAPLGLYFLRHPAAFTNRIGQVGPGGDWNAALDGTVAAFQMIFWRGDPYIRFNLPFRPLFGPIVTLLLVVGLGLTLWRLFRPREVAGSPALARTRETLLLAWIPLMLLPTALAVNEITPSNLRAIGLIPLIFIFPARGVLSIGDWILGIVPTIRGSRITFYVLRSTLFFVVCVLLFFTTARAYFGAYAPRTDLYEASDGDLADIASYLNQADLTGTTAYVGSVHYRHPTLAFLADAYPQIKWLVGGSTLVYPADGVALYLFPRSATPDANWVARYLSDAVSVQAPLASDGAPAFAGYRLTAPSLLPEQVLADFSGVARLLSYRVEKAVSAAAVDVTVIWHILAPPPYPDLSPFYHLTDPWGFVWGQAGPFHYAAADWTPGEVVIDRVQVPIAPGAPPGDYVLRFGLYSPGAAARVPVVDDAGRYAGSTVPLSLTVSRTTAPPDLATLGIRQRLDLDAGSGPTLLGVNLDSVQIRPGERVYLTLFWQAGQDQTDYAVKLSLQGQGENLELYDSAPIHGTYPTSNWAEGEIVVDRYDPRLPLLAADAPPGNYALTLTLTDAGDETEVNSVTLGQLTLIATDRTFEPPAIPLRDTQHAILSGQIEFLGYDLDQTDARPGGTVHLILYWRALAEMETSYTVFTHLLGPDGHIVAQQDNPPIHGTYPTTLWLPGEIIADPYLIHLPPDLSPGDYALETGFYISENGLRLGAPILLNTAVSIPP